jgi:hypothetical protein
MKITPEQLAEFDRIFSTMEYPHTITCFFHFLKTGFSSLALTDDSTITLKEVCKPDCPYFEAIVDENLCNLPLLHYAIKNLKF